MLTRREFEATPPPHPTASQDTGQQASPPVSPRRVSVVIPVKKVNGYVREAVALVTEHFPGCEMLVVPDHDDGVELAGATIVPSSPVTAPGQKRDMAASLCGGDILAFLDDDAYPDPQWLAAALPHFDDDSVAAVGGPGVTPPSNDIRQRASGWILASALGSGPHTYRFRPGPGRDVDDFPSMNLLVRKSAFEAVGGFESHYWPGEDTELCRKLVYGLGKRIVYEPGAVVYHHRRRVFTAHLRQHAQYGLHRGHFARRFPGNSRRLVYAMPGALIVGLTAGLVVALLYPMALYVYLAVVGSYVVGLALTGAWVWYHERSLRLAALTATGIAATHIVYGASYIRGLLKLELGR